MRPVNVAGSPLTKANEASAMTSTGSAMSSRPGGMSRWWTTPGVATTPAGDSTLTAMPLSNSSAASPVVKRSKAALHMP